MSLPACVSYHAIRDGDHLPSIPYFLHPHDISTTQTNTMHEHYIRETTEAFHFHVAKATDPHAD